MIKIINEPIKLQTLKDTAKDTFGNLIKAVVDIETGEMALFGELHSDEEAIMIEKGSKQTNLWGINIYPLLSGDDRIEFDSMINLRPSQNNMSRSVDDPDIQKKIIRIVNKLIEE